MLLKTFLSIKNKLRAYVTVGSFFSVVAIPVQSPDSFVDLKYSDIKPNNVEISKQIKVSVDRSASPLFYKFQEIKKWSQIKVAGKLEVIEKLKSEKDDAYFQVGVIYEGDYKPGWMVRQVLPEWLMTIINLNSKYGLDSVDFHHFSRESGFKAREEAIRDIKLNFISLGDINDKGEFSGEFKLRDKKVLGLWLRADGDDHDGKFNLTLTSLEIEP